MKPHFAALAIIGAMAIGYVLGRNATAAAAAAAASPPAARPSAAPSRADDGELERLRAENKDLGAEIEIQKLQIPMMQQTPVVGRPPPRLALDVQRGGLSRHSMESLGLTEDEAQRGIPILEAAAEQLRKIALEHMDEPVSTGNVVVLRVGAFEEHSKVVYTKLLEDLGTVWNPDTMHLLRNAEPNRVMASLGAGFGERVIMITPDARGRYHVEETVLHARGRSSFGATMDAEQLRRRFGITQPLATTR
jgi:hypothetical protein